MSLALNYEPEVVVNIETLTREEWLDYRRLGIGGSDVAAIMGISPFATIKDLYYDKIGVKPMIDEGESNWVAKEVGHRLEDLVAMIFSKKTGLEAFNQIGKWLESSKISGSRLSARENQHVCVGEIRLTEGGIGQHGNSMGCGDLFGVFNRNGCNSDSCSSHKINYS